MFIGSEKPCTESRRAAERKGFFSSFAKRNSSEKNFRRYDIDLTTVGKAVPAFFGSCICHSSLDSRKVGL